MHMQGRDDQLVVSKDCHYHKPQANTRCEGLHPLEAWPLFAELALVVKAFAASCAPPP